MNEAPPTFESCHSDRVETVGSFKESLGLHDLQAVQHMWRTSQSHDTGAFRQHSLP